MNPLPPARRPWTGVATDEPDRAVQSSSMPQQGPTVFGGRYELHRKLARGGMAEVFLARDQLLDRPVAIKVLVPEFATNPEFVERFRREAQAAANLSHHPNIVAIYDWGEEQGTYFIVMEYVEGRSLADILTSDGRFHPDRASEIAGDVLSALDVAHAAGLVHRDIKPGNIIVSPTGQVKVADFGIATAIAAIDANLTQDGTVMGTATYFSPEQAQGRKVDGRSDLYSVGVVLYEMLLGQPPFSGETPVTIAYKHVQEPPVPLSGRGVAVAPSLEAITMKALEKDPSMRYPGAADFARDLRRYRAGEHQVKRRAATGAQTAPVRQRPPVAASAPTGAAPVAPRAAAPPPGATRVNPAATGAGPRRPPARPPDVGYDDYYDPRPRYDSRGRTAGFIVALLLLLIVLVALVLAFGQTLGLGGDDDDEPATGNVDVPPLINQNIDEAESILTDLGLLVVRSPQPNESFDEGIVFGQDPAAGTRVAVGSAVTLRFSSPSSTIRLPSVTGVDVDEAIALLEELDLATIVETIESDRPPREVIETDPPAGVDLEPGELVTLIVSQGPGESIVPSVSNLELTDAVASLLEAGFTVDTIDEPHETVPLDIVIRTEPAGGSPYPNGSQVVIFRSTGPAQSVVPSVTGLLAETANARLEQAGFVVDLVFEDLPAGSANVGRVITQSPPPAIQQPPGTVVRIVVGREVAATTTTAPPPTVPTTLPPPTAPPPTG